MRLPMLAACLLIVPLGLLAKPPRQAANSAPQTSPRAVSSAPGDPGERVFAANCSRCHQAPMGLPPRITGTVIMHMRTRARLSAQDQRSLLKYLAP